MGKDGAGVVLDQMLPRGTTSRCGRGQKAAEECPHSLQASVLPRRRDARRGCAKSDERGLEGQPGGWMAFQGPARKCELTGPPAIPDWRRDDVAVLRPLRDRVERHEGSQHGKGGMRDQLARRARQGRRNRRERQRGLLAGGKRQDGSNPDASIIDRKTMLVAASYRFTKDRRASAGIQHRWQPVCRRHGCHPLVVRFRNSSVY